MELLYLSLATFKITRIITKEYIFEDVRNWFGKNAAINDEYQPIRQFLAKLITCPYCLGVWVAGFLYMFRKPLKPIINIFIVALGQSLIQSVDDKVNGE
jgi:hypothetical protein